MPTGIIGFFKRVYWAFASIDNVWLFVLDYFGLIKKRTVIYNTKNGLRVLVRSGTADKSEIALIFSDREYPKKFFPDGKNKVVLDVGAHIGSFSLYLKKELIKKNPIIYAIEPNPENFAILKKNVELNHFDNINCCKLAIGNWSGTGFMDCRKSSDAVSVERKPFFQENKFFRKCQIMTLEKFYLKNKIGKVDLLKIDCEGMEYGIFKDSIEFIKKHVKTIFLEVHDFDQVRNYPNFEKYILSQGFIVEAKMFPTVAFLRNTAIK